MHTHSWLSWVDDGDLDLFTPNYPHLFIYTLILPYEPYEPYIGTCTCMYSSNHTMYSFSLEQSEFRHKRLLVCI